MQDIIKSAFNEIMPELISSIKADIMKEFADNKLKNASAENKNWKEDFARAIKALAHRDYAEFRAITSGNYIGWVPEEFQKEVIQKIAEFNPFRQFATVLSVNALKGHVPAFLASVTISRVAEGASYPEQNPAGSQVQWSLEKFGGAIGITEELLENSGPNLVDVLVKAIASAYAGFERSKFTNGSGTNEPKGFRNETYANTLTYSGADTLIDAYYTLPAEYAERAVWLTSYRGARVIRKLKDSQGRYLWTDGFGETPATILGRPVYIIKEIPENLGQSANQTEIYLGDFSYYYIFDGYEGKIEATTNDIVGFLSDVVYLKFRKYLDGKMAFTDPVVKITAVA